MLHDARQTSQNVAGNSLHANQKMPTPPSNHLVLQ
jgi:hypothetical protein